MKGQIKQQQEQQTNLNQTIKSQDDKIESLQDELGENSSMLEDQQQVIDQLQDYGNDQVEDEDNSLVVLKSYTVQAGDSLGAICEKFNIDYSNNISIIKSLNGIEDVDKIYVGQVLLLPIQKS